MNVDIMDLQAKVKVDRKRITSHAESVLKAMGEDNTELSLTFVDDAYIKRLNMRYRNVNAATDVLAFPMREEKGPSKSCPILGDVVISTDAAKREAYIRHIPIQKEIFLYLTHGILHLLGYDDTTASGRTKMRRKEKELMGKICDSRAL